LCAIHGTSEKTDKHALHALDLLVPGLLRCKHDPSATEARLQCQLGAVDAMAALTGSSPVDLGASHGIGHQLGPLGVGHGETSCILLPAVCKFNAKHGANREQQERVRQFLVRNGEVGRVLRERGVDADTADLGDVLDAVIRELGMPRSLKEVGVGSDKLDELAANSLHDRWCKTNPVPLTDKEQVLEILEMVVE
jgi:alcohol dehydrogenase class IV